MREKMSLSRLYYNDDSPGYLGSVKKLTNALRERPATAKRSARGEKHVKKWLSGQESYTLHKPVRRRIARNYYNTFEINGLWQADIIDLRLLKKFNDGHSYLLVAIDVFSKFVYVRPLKTKSAIEVNKAIRDMIDGAIEREGVRRNPKVLQTDKGKEFKNQVLKRFLTSRNIQQQFPITQSKHKAAVVERFNRTLQMLIRRYFTSQGGKTRRYIEVLPKLIHLYNNTIHSTTKTKPSEVSIRNVKRVYENSHRYHRQRPAMTIYSQPYQLGDRVRLARHKAHFEPGYSINWTREIFTISNIIRKKPLFLYQLQDMHKRQIREKFYGSELQRVNI